MIPIQESERLFSKQELILSSTVLVTLKELLVLTNKLEYAHKKIGAKSNIINLQF